MKLRISVEGKAYDVDVEVLEEGNGQAPAPNYAHRPPVSAPALTPRPALAPAPVAQAAGGDDADNGERVVKAPIVGTVMQVKVKPGDNVEIHQVLLVMEAMKMETNIASPIPGRVKSVLAAPGDAVKAGQVLVELE